MHARTLEVMLGNPQEQESLDDEEREIVLLARRLHVHVFNHSQGDGTRFVVALAAAGLLRIWSQYGAEYAAAHGAEYKTDDIADCIRMITRWRLDDCPLPPPE